MLSEDHSQIHTSAAPDQARSGSVSKSRRGSVLVFTVLLLVLLAGIGTAFVMFVNLEYAASGNALRSTQSRATAETGLEHARRAIRESVLTCRFESPDGYFNLAGTTRPYVDETRGLFRFFEYHSTETPTPSAITTVIAAKSALNADKSGTWAGWRDFAWLYWNADATYCGVAGLDGQNSGTPHTNREITNQTYTESPLASFAYPNGQPRTDRSNSVEHAGLARRFVIYNPVTDFFTDASKAVSPYRGEYYVWVTDLDSKLYAPYSGVAWGMTTATDVNEILKRLRSYGSKGNWGFDDANDKFKLGITDTEIAAMVAKPGTYSSIEDVSLCLNRTIPASGSGNTVWDHLYYRYGLERYFTCWADNGTAVKVYGTALNVNTASYEILTAALSRIPLVDSVTVPVPSGDTVNLAKASYLAKRICAKRPFVCRIDFEDFLAAHLNVDPTGTIIDDPRNGATVPQPPVRMVYLAIPKREYTDANDTTVPRTVLTLSQLMEATVTDTDSRYTWLRSAADQQSRFLWFRDLPLYADSTAPLSDAGGNAFLSVKAFNNILNSISGERPGGGYGYSFYSYDSVAVSFDGTTLGVPKFAYNELKNTPPAGITAGSDTYVIERGDTSTNDEVGELFAWRLTKSTGYYETVFKDCDDTQIFEYAKPIPIARPVPPAQVAVISAGTDTVLQTPAISDGITTDDIAGTNSIDDPSTGAFVCDSTIHAPLRAYRHTHTSEPVVTDAAFNTDVSWSPRFCFRSRFFKVYVLARSIVTLKGNSTPVYGPPSRLEAVYDAVDDKILWRRWQATELRRLSDPVP